ncbi:MAG: acyl-CoA thioesterase [Alphaproteobacteria bacterium]|nr:acyl-CoA thioesterase [Alphaproteobacteria bacterium]
MGAVFTVTRNLRFADCDPAGIAFYPRLLEHVNNVVEDWFAGPLDCSFHELHFVRERGVPTVEIQVKFLRPGALGDAIDWRLTVKTLSRASMTLSIIGAHENGKDMLRAEPTLVHSNFTLDPPRAESFPDDLREKIAAFRAAPSASP